MNFIILRIVILIIMQVQIKEIKDIEQNQKLTSNQWTWQCEGINVTYLLLDIFSQ